MLLKDVEASLDFKVPFSKETFWDFPGGPVVKKPPANAGDTELIPGPGRFDMLGATKPVHRNH